MSVGDHHCSEYLNNLEGIYDVSFWISLLIGGYSNRDQQQVTR